MNKGAFDTLNERGFIKQSSNAEGLKQMLDSEEVTFYVGFDPTGNSLHVGHLVPLMAMSHLQKAGHRPIALVGGGTARIGDPSGKTETRQMLTIETIGENAGIFRKQISRFLDFSGGRALMIDNAEWLASLNYVDFLREIGKHFSVNRMLSFEAYKQRLEKGLSFIEFNYQLLQSYDFLVLHKDYGCKLQMGGDDQWGNIVSGIELIRRVEGKEVHAVTSPLVTRSDGKKMGKTEKGALFLDPDLVSPYAFYQYWMNVPDADVRHLLCLFTYLPIAEISALAELKHEQANRAKEVLAFELTQIVHGREAAAVAQKTSRDVFSEQDSGDLSAMPSIKLPADEVTRGMPVVDLFSRTELCSSKSEARRLITQGGAYVNNRGIENIDTVIGNESINDGLILLRAGKKRFYKVIVTS